MTRKLASAGVLALGLTLAGAVAWGAGIFSTLPIVGDTSFCASYIGSPTGQTGATGTGGGAGAVCGQTVPAGPTALTGEELIPADIPNTIGAQPLTVAVPAAMLGASPNRLIGGDFTTNLAQRLQTTKGIAALASTSPTAAIITADRWWVVAPAAGITTTIDSTAATAVIPGLNNTKALRVARTSSGAAGIACVGQTLDAAASQPLIGNNAVFSFWEENGSTQSATNGNITVNVDYTSAADGAATQATLGYAGLNGSLFALGDVGLTSAGPTNMTRAIAGLTPGTPGSVSSAGVSTIPASTTWTRYGVYAPIPVNVPGTTTPVTSVSVSVCWTPTATTAVATDYIEIEGLQLEAKPSTATASMPAGVISPSAFERRPPAVEQALELYYWYFNYESQTLASAVATCENTSASVAQCYVPFPEPMRLAPVVKYTAGFQAFAQVAETSVSACSALAAATTLTTVPSNAGALVACTASVGAAGTANHLLALGTSSATGIISASAEP
ncbi:MAG: hypothetical protein P4L76_17825 [Beijerinckiaceae bacterium]|nr:hypothetical protein [Beijerinckiaceae bacterium]